MAETRISYERRISEILTGETRRDRPPPPSLGAWTENVLRALPPAASSGPWLFSFGPSVPAFSMALPWGPPLTSHSPSSQGARGIFPKQARITTTYRKRVRGPRWSRSAPFGLTCEACPSPPGRSPPVRPASRDRPLPLAAPMAPGRCSPGASSAAWHAPAGSPHICAHAGAQAQLACPSSVPHDTPSSGSAASSPWLLGRLKC